MTRRYLAPLTAVLALLAHAPAGRADSKFRLVETKALAKGLQVCLAHECGAVAEDVTLTLFTGVPWHNQIRTVASGKQVGTERNANATGTVIEHCKWQGADTAKVTIPYDKLKELGVAAGSTVYLCGFWPQFNHVWGYGHTAQTEVPLTLPELKAQKNALLGRAGMPLRWMRAFPARPTSWRASAAASPFPARALTAPRPWR